MTMELKQWEEILSAINEQEDLSQDNVIKKIKEGLREVDPEEYEKWEEAGFDLNHLFEVEDRGQVLKFDLLLIAVQYDCVNILNLLIKNGANIEHFQKITGSTILRCAIETKNIEVIKDLIARGDINVNEKSEQTKGYTPLHYAARGESMEMVRFLIEEGADPSLKDNAGKTPRDLARDDTIKDSLREAEEEQLKRSNTETHLPQKDTPPLLKRTKEKQPTSAIAKGVFAGGAVAVLGAAIAVALFATGTVAVELMPIMIAAAIVTVAALAVGGITYMLSEPSTKMDKTKGAQNVNGNEVPTLAS